MSKTSQDLLNNAVQTALAVGLPVAQTSPRSHDPFRGYSPSDLVEAVGDEDVREISSLYEKEKLAELEGAEVTIGSPVVGLRGKSKGLLGWVSKEMPSQYDQNEMAFLVVSVDPSKGSAWVKSKSLKLRVPLVGEEDEMFRVRSAREVCVGWGRGHMVESVLTGARGILVGFGQENLCVPQVCVQWVSTGSEEWVLPTLLKKA